MSIQILGSGNTTNIAVIDSNRNLNVIKALPVVSPTSGYYSVAGNITSAIAASLGANVTLMSMRMSAGSTRKAYINKFRTVIAGVTAGTSALVAGTLGLQRFTTATPTGGTARTPNKQSTIFPDSDMTDVRDDNAALTVTSVVFGTVVSNALIPLFIATGGMYLEWIVEPPFPIILAAGDGLCLRTQVAMPATQTWIYSYTVQWSEK